MPELKLKQLRYESDNRKQLLSFMMDENVLLKQKLSEVLNDKFNQNLLEEVENFQSRFIKEDELIGLLRNEVAELDKLLVREIFEDGMIMKKVDSQLNKMRNNIETAERQFARLKSEFNSFVSENIFYR